MYDWVTLLYSRNWHNIVNQLYLKNKEQMEGLYVCVHKHTYVRFIIRSWFMWLWRLWCLNNLGSASWRPRSTGQNGHAKRYMHSFLPSFHSSSLGPQACGSCVCSGPRADEDPGPSSRRWAESTASLPPLFCSLRSLKGLDDARAPWGGPSILPGQLTQILISSGKPSQKQL